ncbi:Glucosidase 2 subunit alpha [Venturia nashicola]|nr:Glucosidase 2 subunit alpha [Venturia nashicola]
MASRKLFNCILDDTALIAGLKRSTRDGVKKWVNSGSIRIFVPLHTLDRLRRLARSDERSSTYAEEALTWLDTITSLPDDAPNRHAVDLVHLQGGYEVFERWDEVEQFLLPQTLLSMESDIYEDPDSATESLADLRQDAMPDNTSEGSQESIEARTASPVSVSSAASPGSLNAAPYKDSKSLQPIGTGRPSHKKSDSNVSSISGESTGKKQRRSIPIALRPFFNYILWRIHQEENASAALETFILVTNDPLKQQIAHRFGIRVKKLEQLREIVAREERDIKNREQMHRRETAIAVSEPVIAPDMKTEGEDEDEIVLQRVPPKGPQAMNGRAVWDPNAFGRAPYSPLRPAGRGVPFRARASPVRGSFTPRAMATQSPRQPPIDLSNPIDPDVFSRPPPANRVQCGGRRRLWEPT